MQLYRALALVALAGSAAAQSDTNLLETFVSAFTGTSTDDARELIDTFESCTTDGNDSPLFQDVLRMSVNATRACTSTDVNRKNYRKCVDRAATALRMASSPYDAFSTRALDDADIAALERCETSLTTDDAIVDAYLVIAKRFVQCEISLTASQRQSVLDVFKGEEQSKELMRGQLSNLCGALHFSGETHKEFVQFATMSLKNYAALFPNRR